MFRKFTLLVAGIAIGGIGASVLSQGGYLSGSSAEAANRSTYRQLHLFGDIFERIRSDYVLSLIHI